MGRHVFEQSPSRSLNSTKTQKRQTDGMIVNGYTDNKINYRSAQSGPSSLESGKASSMFTSGPSSIDSGKVSFSRTSGHSSLDSQCSANTAVGPTNTNGRSILLLNGSPRATPRHQAIRARAEQNARCQRSATPSRILEEITNQPASRCSSSLSSNRGGKDTTNNNLFNVMPNSSSNNSITLQVTTSNGSQSSIPSTKIFVQNSPARSVITLENGKLMENSNVYIINNETTTNAKGEIIKKTLSRQHNPAAKATTQIYKDSSISENDANSETCDSLSYMGSETSPDNLDTLSSLEPMEPTKFTKNINNDATMNNSRKLCLQLPSQGSNNIVYKNNVLKNESNPNSPSSEKPVQNTDFNLAGSVGNLRFYEKQCNNNEKPSKLNSNCDLKNLRYESVGNLQKATTNNALNSNPALNVGEMAQLLQKTLVAVGSEPNLALKDNNCTANTDKAINKSEAIDRRFSLTKDASSNAATNDKCNTHTAEELYNFPSLTDLSFNFTSLAAQKILQGVSLNSIDTLVELNMAAAAAAAAVAVNQKEKQQNNQTANSNGTPAVCTDYGLV